MIRELNELASRLTGKDRILVLRSTPYIEKGLYLKPTVYEGEEIRYLCARCNRRLKKIYLYCPKCGQRQGWGLL